MEHGERSKPKEDLVLEAGGIIYQNLISSGLAEKIVKASKHGVLPFSDDFYTGVSFAFEMGTGDFENGIWVQPRLSTSSGRGDVATKLYRLGIEGAENTVWQGVASGHKQALLQCAIEYQTAKYKAELRSVGAMREGGVEERNIKRVIEEANKNLKLLGYLAMALTRDDLIVKISSSLAGLSAQLKK